MWMLLTFGYVISSTLVVVGPPLTKVFYHNPINFIKPIKPVVKKQKKAHEAKISVEDLSDS